MMQDMIYEYSLLQLSTLASGYATANNDHCGKLHLPILPNCFSHEAR